MKRSMFALAALAVAACAARPPAAPTTVGRDLATPFAEALRLEALGDQTAAVAGYLAVLDSAAKAEGDPWQLAAITGALDALVSRSVSALQDISADSALAYRSGKFGEIRTALERVRGEARGPFAAGLIARALEELEVHTGNAQAAEKWRIAKGCAREATVTGPMAWAPISGVDQVDPLAAADAPVDALYSTHNSFDTKIAPAVVRDRGCWLPLDAASPLLGVRDVIVDVDVPEAQTIGVAMRVPDAATLRVGGKLVVTRPYELGGDDVARFARVEVGKGRVRLVARVGQDDASETIELGAWDHDGRPLAMRAPAVGQRGGAFATTARAEETPAPKTDAERLLSAVAALAWNDGRSAEALLATAAQSPTASVTTLLTYARAVEQAHDLSPVHRQERLRAIHERVLEAQPGAWEAVIAHAQLAGSRKGQGDARIVALGDLDAHAAAVPPATRPLVDAFDAGLSGREHLYERAKVAFERSKAALGAAPLVRDVERLAFDRSGETAIAFECAATGRDSLACYSALANAGRAKDAEAELARLRTLRGAGSDLAQLALRDALGRRDLERANAEWARVLAGERTLDMFAALGSGNKPAAAELLAMAPSARDAPASIPPLLRAAGDDPSPELERRAIAAITADRSKTADDGAATAVLLHEERYDLSEGGLLRFVLVDARRVTGTTDVEDNAAAYPPSLAGRSTMRILRRRIYKKDGRVIEPERAPNASQAHADLAQLEAGDAVLAIYEGWALPGETGDVGFDTPDLLPERTAVAASSIEVRLPAGLKGSLYSHPMLGTPAESREGDRRVLRWSLATATTRRREDGVPRMDRDVGVSFSTLTWDRVAEGLRETLLGLDEHEPEVAAFAREAARGKTDKAAVSAIVEKVGEVVREASPATLADLAQAHASGAQSTTARTVLTDREGSRTWLIVRALRELGISADVVIAENEPFSAHADFPPHYGRFAHPLAVAHTKADGDVWIDADVSGPPLPAGRISPELRGRMALSQSGAVSPLPVMGADRERDEIDIRLVVDASGDAKGSVTVLLRGREAQEISEMLFRVVGIERERALRGIVLGWVPAANVDEVGLSSSEGSWQIAVRAAISAPGFAQPEGKQWVIAGIEPVHVVYPRPGVSTLGATYASQGGRKEALAISRAMQFHVRRRIELPKGAIVSRLPGPLDLKLPNLEASRKLSVSANLIEEDLTMGLATGTIAADRYAEFAQGAHRVDDAFLASLRITPRK